MQIYRADLFIVIVVVSLLVEQMLLVMFVHVFHETRDVVHLHTTKLPSPDPYHEASCSVPGADTPSGHQNSATNRCILCWVRRALLERNHQMTVLAAPPEKNPLLASGLIWIGLSEIVTADHNDFGK